MLCNYCVDTACKLRKHTKKLNKIKDKEKLRKIKEK